MVKKKYKGLVPRSDKRNRCKYCLIVLPKSFASTHPFRSTIERYPDVCRKCQLLKTK